MPFDGNRWKRGTDRKLEWSVSTWDASNSYHAPAKLMKKVRITKSGVLKIGKCKLKKGAYDLCVTVKAKASKRWMGASETKTIRLVVK